MSIFQCSKCGCAENTALCNYHYEKLLKEPPMCSACTKHPKPERKGKLGEWHGQFERIFLPKGMFITNRVGNLVHKETGDENYRRYAIPEPEIKQ